MRITELRAENYKRLKAIRWCPGPHLNEVSGVNAQGKSSLLDAIYVSLGGKKVDCAEPIRHGQGSAEVTLTLGDLRVRRTWTATGSYLCVEDANGSAARSPQALLDSLASHLAMDPVRFSMMSEKDQIKTLVDTFDLDVQHLDNLVATASESRRDKTREQKRLRAAADVIQVDDTLSVEATEQIIDEIKAHLTEARARVAALEAELQAASSDWAKARDWSRKIELNSEADFVSYEIECLDREIEDVRRMRREKLAQVGTLVPGLEIGEETLLYQGSPFSQCSGAQRVLVGLAVAAASDPKIRIILIRDGSLLDSSTMQQIEEFAERWDLQILVERVADETPGRHGVLIEDGTIVGRNEPEDAPKATGKQTWDETIAEGKDIF